MSLTASEQATVNFYEWDHLGRGYHLFDEQVDIEPTYRPFQHTVVSERKYIDDGKVPNVFSQIANLFKEKKPQKQEVRKPKIRANKNQYSELNTGFSLHFKRGQEITCLNSMGFISTMSYSEAHISYEILGTYDEITIRFICSEEDKLRIESQLIFYFPSVFLKEVNADNLPFNINESIAICDFGLNDETACPLAMPTSFAIDPLTSIIATMDNLRHSDVALFQIIFKGATAPWARDIQYSVSDGMGGSFFSNSPEMTTHAKKKVSMSLFSCVVRIAAQGNTKEQSSYLATQLTSSITTISSSEQNKLIPLSNKGYDYHNHLNNVYRRESNRLGMLLNSNELASFVHYPHKTVYSEKFGLAEGVTKKIPKNLLHQKYSLGINNHKGVENKVTVNDDERLRHTHIIGATGVGKSTLIAQMIFEDIHYGNGCALFDPHGDIVDDVIQRIPKERRSDVILIDSSDTEYPIGFNLLEAHSESEKIVLSSDLVKSFKRHATAWGDNMTAVLTNVINAFLESSANGTLIELKRFLLEDTFRQQFLNHVEDQSIHYYWQYEYPMMKKGIAPLLTRIDTFLRPKIVRHILAQKSGISFKECIDEKKIVLIKLSQGLIGEENSYLLGSLFLSKFNQAALGRQALKKHERPPFYLYLDEFHNFITPSITSILRGARKYGLGLVLAHQELAQIEETKVLNSVISNPHIRICFRLGDGDARRLESGFSYFEQEDLQNLAVGEAIMRVGMSNQDFNIQTLPFSHINEEIAQESTNAIVTNSRNLYAQPLAEIQDILTRLLPKFDSKAENISKQSRSKSPNTPKIEHVKQSKEVEVIRKYKQLQNHVRALAIQRGFEAVFDEKTTTGGRVDIGLIRDSIRIAVEISVTNTIDFEVENIQKCIYAGYTHVYMVSESMTHLKNIQKRADATLDKHSRQCIRYLLPLELAENLNDLSVSQNNKNLKRVVGRRVKGNNEVPHIERDKLIQQEEASISNRDHSYLQHTIKKLGQEHGFISTVEKGTADGRRIDVTLEKDTTKIAFEISITNTPEYEVKNIKKCFSEGYLPVVMVSKNRNHLNKIERLAKKKLSEKDFQYIIFVQPSEVVSVLKSINTTTKNNQEVVKGFQITTQFEQSRSVDAKGIREHIAKLLFKKK